MYIVIFNTQVNNCNITHQEKQSKRSLVITGQYILKVMNSFIDIVTLEPKKDERTKVQLS